MTSSCIMDTGRWFDPATNEWVYENFCFNENHKDQRCPNEGEMFRTVTKP